MVELAEMTKSAWEEGFDAFTREAKGRAENPYASDVEKFKCDEWTRGWDAAFADFNS